MSTSSQTATKPLLSDSSYNKLKQTATLVLPAVAALYVALSNLWGWPHTEAVAGSVAALNTFVGALVALSSKQYNNSDAKYVGVIQAHDAGPNKITANLVLNTEDPSEILQMNEATFKVESTGETPIVQDPGH